VIRCHWCPEDAPAPAAALVLVRSPDCTRGPRRLAYGCPECIDRYRLRLLPAAPADAMAVLLGATVPTAGLLVALMVLAVRR
jgi:hypothetical protein